MPFVAYANVALISTLPRLFWQFGALAHVFFFKSTEQQSQATQEALHGSTCRGRQCGWQQNSLAESISCIQAASLTGPHAFKLRERIHGRERREGHLVARTDVGADRKPMQAQVTCVL